MIGKVQILSKSAQFVIHLPVLPYWSIVILLLSVLLLLGNCMNDKVLYYNIIYRGWCIGYAYKYIILSLARDLGIPMFRPGDCAAHAPTTTRRHRILYHNNIIMTLYLKWFMNRNPINYNINKYNIGTTTVHETEHEIL